LIKVLNFSIDTMVYVSSDETLWCGIRDRIKIYESVTLSGEIDDILFESRIVRIIYKFVSIFLNTVDRV